MEQKMARLGTDQARPLKEKKKALSEDLLF